VLNIQQLCCEEREKNAQSRDFRSNKHDYEEEAIIGRKTDGLTCTKKI
jgi:hypothetical protein